MTPLYFIDREFVTSAKNREFKILAVGKDRRGNMRHRAKYRGYQRTLLRYRYL